MSNKIVLELYIGVFGTFKVILIKHQKYMEKSYVYVVSTYTNLSRVGLIMVQW